MGQPADVAESYPVSESGLEAGDIVALGSEKVSLFNTEDNSGSETKIGGLVKASSQYKNILGVISTKPGFLLSGQTASSVPVALAGRVPVKVSLENGPIHTGDYLALSTTTSGVAAKAIVSGNVVGIALQDYTDVSEGGKVLTFIQAGWQNIEAPSIALEGSSGQLSGEIADPNDLTASTTLVVGSLLVNQNG
jgi:hypothetical protein